MPHRFAEIAFTPKVQAEQALRGTRAQYSRVQASDGPNDALGPREAELLAAADSLFLATVSETEWPYVQHRGGPPGFLKVLSPGEIAFADFRGNMQYVSAGNAVGNNRVAIIVLDYARRLRLKLLGHLRFVNVESADPALVKRLEMPGYRARVERIALINVAAFDWNCPQHITPRYTLGEIEALAQPLHARIAALEAELEATRASASSRRD